MLKKLKDYRRIVVKIGSALLVDRATGLKRDWLESLGQDIAALHHAGVEVLVVSSGAIALGRTVLGLPKKALKLEESQAAAAAGQIALAKAYADVLRRSFHALRPESRHAFRYRGAPPLSQCARDHRDAVEAEGCAGYQ